MKCDQCVFYRLVRWNTLGGAFRRISWCLTNFWFRLEAEIQFRILLSSNIESTECAKFYETIAGEVALSAGLSLCVLCSPALSRPAIQLFLTGPDLTDPVTRWLSKPTYLLRQLVGHRHGSSGKLRCRCSPCRNEVACTLYVWCA